MKINIDKTPRILKDLCFDCNKPLIQGINYSGWNAYTNNDGVLVASPICNTCLNKRSGPGEKTGVSDE
jgi:hypothetical protein